MYQNSNRTACVMSQTHTHRGTASDTQTETEGVIDRQSQQTLIWSLHTVYTGRFQGVVQRPSRRSMQRTSPAGTVVQICPCWSWRHHDCIDTTSTPSRSRQNNSPSLRQCN